jgi:uncharacterized protein YjiS (DUF1127 family)
MHIANDHPLTNSQVSERTLDISPVGAAGWIGRMIHRWRERADEQRELALMDERALRDARVTRWDVQRELARPFWRG